jgi:hypothetical protein
MIRSITFLAGAALFAVSLSGPAFSQGAPQTVSLMKVDPASLATGYRTSKVVGSTVVNETNQTVGTIDDLIVTPTEKVPFAVLSVGGFLGMGTKYVVVPFFPVVCVGGSAGGLDAYTRLLRHLPADMGVAIVIVNHLRTVATLLHEILPRYTRCRLN